MAKWVDKEGDLDVGNAKWVLKEIEVFRKRKLRVFEGNGFTERGNRSPWRERERERELRQGSEITIITIEMGNQEEPSTFVFFQVVSLGSTWWAKLLISKTYLSSAIPLLSPINRKVYEILFASVHDKVKNPLAIGKLPQRSQQLLFGAHRKSQNSLRHDWLPCFSSSPRQNAEKDKKHHLKKSNFITKVKTLDMLCSLNATTSHVVSIANRLLNLFG
ncbi:hypothetical protein NC652_004292 [Populus alba x Populus x berolinensis]|nr:hypothetical protein NC652_004292 [Populus alba x Populus x berolinensis]